MASRVPLMADLPMAGLPDARLINSLGERGSKKSENRPFRELLLSKLRPANILGKGPKRKSLFMRWLERRDSPVPICGYWQTAAFTLKICYGQEGKWIGWKCWFFLRIRENLLFLLPALLFQRNNHPDPNNIENSETRAVYPRRENMSTTLLGRKRVYFPEKNLPARIDFST